MRRQRQRRRRKRVRVADAAGGEPVDVRGEAVGISVRADAILAQRIDRDQEYVGAAQRPGVSEAVILGAAASRGGESRDHAADELCPRSAHATDCARLDGAALR